MASADLINAVFRRLANDATFLAFKSLTPASPMSSKVAYVNKEEETDGIVDSSTIPIVLLYTRPGHATQRIYTGKVVIDCFAADGNTARMMVDQTDVLINNWVPDSQSAYGCAWAYDTSFKTGITGVKGHRVFYDVMQYTG